MIGIKQHPSKSKIVNSEINQTTEYCVFMRINVCTNSNISLIHLLEADLVEHSLFQGQAGANSLKTQQNK